MHGLNDRLRKKLFTMTGLVQEAVEKAVSGLLQGNGELFKEVVELEKKINKLDVEIDDECFKLIALKQPMGKELRFIIACLKTNTDLERIGDQAINISQTGGLLVASSHFIPPELRRMIQEVLLMLNESLDSFMKLDREKSKVVFRRELTVNEMKKTIFKQVISGMKHQEGDEIEAQMELLLISRNLEKIGDHAKNIAEYLIFLEEGKDVRHSPFLSKDLLHDSPK